MQALRTTAPRKSSSVWHRDLIDALIAAAIMAVVALTTLL